MRLPRTRRRASLLLAGTALLAACKAAGSRPASAAPVATPVFVAPANEAAFQALRVALSEGDDERAQQIVAALRARELAPRELEMVEAAERVLGGRALVRGLELALASEPVPDEDGRFRLVLVARSRASSGVRLALPPADLKRLRATMDARGVEGLEYESRASHALAGLELAPNVERRVVLVEYELPLGRALGVRDRWRLETRSGEVECAGETYPAANVAVAGCERERLSPLLDPGAAGAGALAARLEGRDAPTPRELLELALRTPREEREAALASLAPVVARLAREAPARVEAAEPALRWLTQNRDLGPDADAWARWLDARVAAGAEPPERPADGLDLPERPRGVGREGRSGA